MSETKLLVHTCCAPCFIAPYQKLKVSGFEISAFWFNPNIHPLLEYQKRRNALRDFTTRENIPLLEQDSYGLEPFLRQTLDKISERCTYCYESRLEATAKKALEQGFNAFTTTLLYSKYQKHELIVDIALQMSARFGVEFYYQDWRNLWQEGIKLSKEAGMYRQPYCGCIFSEEDRYREQIQGNRLN